MGYYGLAGDTGQKAFRLLVLIDSGVDPVFVTGADDAVVISFHQLVLVPGDPAPFQAAAGLHSLEESALHILRFVEGGDGQIHDAVERDLVEGNAARRQQEAAVAHGSVQNEIGVGQGIGVAAGNQQVAGGAFQSCQRILPVGFGTVSGDGVLAEIGVEKVSKIGGGQTGNGILCCALGGFFRGGGQFPDFQVEDRCGKIGLSGGGIIEILHGRIPADGGSRVIVGVVAPSAGGHAVDVGVKIDGNTVAAQGKQVLQIPFAAQLALRHQIGADAGAGGVFLPLGVVDEDVVHAAVLQLGHNGGGIVKGGQRNHLLHGEAHDELLLHNAAIQLDYQRSALGAGGRRDAAFVQKVVPIGGRHIHIGKILAARQTVANGLGGNGGVGVFDDGNSLIFLFDLHHGGIPVEEFGVGVAVLVALAGGGGVQGGSGSALRQDGGAGGVTPQDAENRQTDGFRLGGAFRHYDGGVPTVDILLVLHGRVSDLLPVQQGAGAVGQENVAVSGTFRRVEIRSHGHADQPEQRVCLLDLGCDHGNFHAASAEGDVDRDLQSLFREGKLDPGTVFDAHHLGSALADAVGHTAQLVSVAHLVRVMDLDQSQQRVGRGIVGGAGGNAAPAVAGHVRHGEGRLLLVDVETEAFRFGV